VKIFSDACNANIAGGCAELGHAYSEGGVLPQDGKRADDAYEKACRLDPSLCD
jgi:TPR repeat protein